MKNINQLRKLILAKRRLARKLREINREIDEVQQSREMNDSMIEN